MAGGIGSRFWPVSKTSHPKQFIDILGTGKSLLQSTYDRCIKVCPPENIYIVTNESYTELVIKQLPNLDHKHILAEPSRKNTAPCIAYAAYKIAGIDSDANMVVTPSDHVITKEDDFVKTLETAFTFTEKNNSLVTFGIKPDRPETGYGYIQFIESEGNNNQVCKVKTFTEKPNLEMAKFFLQSGEFLWNAGIFVWNMQTILKAFKEYLPDVDRIFAEGIGLYNTDKENDFIHQAYAMCPNISIDYALMEKAKNVFVVAADIGWSDLGTWGSQYQHSHLDKAGNAVVGNNVMLYGVKNSIVNMPKNKLVVLQGLEDYIVVESDNILLVCKRSDEQQIRQFVNDVKLSKGERYI